MHIKQWMSVLASELIITGQDQLKCEYPRDMAVAYWDMHGLIQSIERQIWTR